MSGTGWVLPDRPHLCSAATWGHQQYAVAGYTVVAWLSEGLSDQVVWYCAGHLAAAGYQVRDGRVTAVAKQPA